MNLLLPATQAANRVDFYIHIDADELWDSFGFPVFIGYKSTPVSDAEYNYEIVIHTYVYVSLRGSITEMYSEFYATSPAYQPDGYSLSNTVVSSTHRTQDWEFDLETWYLMPSFLPWSFPPNMYLTGYLDVHTDIYGYQGDAGLTCSMSTHSTTYLGWFE